MLTENVPKAIEFLKEYKPTSKEDDLLGILKAVVSFSQMPQYNSPDASPTSSSTKFQIPFIFQNRNSSIACSLTKKVTEKIPNLLENFIALDEGDKQQVVLLALSPFSNKCLLKVNLLFSSIIVDMLPRRWIIGVMNIAIFDE